MIFIVQATCPAGHIGAADVYDEHNEHLAVVQARVQAKIGSAVCPIDGAAYVISHGETAFSTIDQGKHHAAKLNKVAGR